MAPTIPSQDYYVVLEVRSSACHDEIKVAYRRLILQYHPDRNKGSTAATAKTQLLNAAWEVLGDSSRRREYDLTQPCSTASTAKPPPRPSPFKPRPQSNQQPPPPPRSNPTAHEDTGLQAESRKKRQEWLSYELAQEQRIRQNQKQVKDLEVAIAALNAKILANQERLGNDRWNIYTSARVNLSEDERNDIQRQSLDSEAAVRIKKMAVIAGQLRVRLLKEELVRRRGVEAERVGAGAKGRDRKKAEREKAEREKAEREKAERQKAEREKAEREKAERERAERERAEREKVREVLERAVRMAKKKADKEVREKAQKDAAKRAETTQQKSQETTWKNSEEFFAQFDQKQAAHTPQTRSSPIPDVDCLHRGWWPKIVGRADCSGCTRPLFKFASQCPGCGILACYECRVLLQAGGTPQASRGHAGSYGKAQFDGWTGQRATGQKSSKPAGSKSAFSSHFCEFDDDDDDDDDDGNDYYDDGGTDDYFYAD